MAQPRNRSSFAGGDQAYLREQQYADSSHLTTRASLHAKYGTAPTSWFDWVGARIDLAQNASVLEVGCGAGWLWEETSVPVRAGVELTLVDLSPGMVDEAVKRVRETGRFASVRGEAADAQALPLPARAFDRVIANHMLYHLPDPELGVSELARVVRPHGAVIAATNGRRHMMELRRLRDEAFATDSGAEAVDGTLDVFGADNGFAMLRDHFDDVRWLQFPDELRCTNPVDVVTYICSSPPGDAAQQGDRDRLATAVDRAFTAGGGTLTITKDVGCFVCRAPKHI